MYIKYILQGDTPTELPRLRSTPTVSLWKVGDYKIGLTRVQNSGIYSIKILVKTNQKMARQTI